MTPKFCRNLKLYSGHAKASIADISLCNHRDDRLVSGNDSKAIGAATSRSTSNASDAQNNTSSTDDTFNTAAISVMFEQEGCVESQVVLSCVETVIVT